MAEKSFSCLSSLAWSLTRMSFYHYKHAKMSQDTVSPLCVLADIVLLTFQLPAPSQAWLSGSTNYQVCCIRADPIRTRPILETEP